MSWSPDLFIGEFRPWPDSVYVVRGKSDESRRYVPEDFSAMSRENAELRELVRDIADHIKHGDGFGIDRGWVLDRIRELGIEVNE